MAKKLPHIPFYYKDWLADTRLSSVSAAARGVWIDLLCLMWDCDERGVLIVGDHPWTEQQLSAMIRGDSDANLACIRELLDAGVARRDKRGAIFNARMVADEALRQKRAAAGAKGGSKKASKRLSKPKAKHEQIPANANANANASETEVEVEDHGPQFRRDFWDAYPPVNKTHPQHAERVWYGLPVEDRQKAVAAVSKYAEAKRDDPKVLRPDRFLEAGAGLWDQYLKGQQGRGFSWR